MSPLYLFFSHPGFFGNDVGVYISNISRILIRRGIIRTSFKNELGYAL
jgi:hypothetical protein